MTSHHRRAATGLSRNEERRQEGFGEALTLCDIERKITGRPLEERHAARQARSRPKVDAFKEWAEAQLRRVSGKSDLAKAFRHALKRWLH